MFDELEHYKQQDHFFFQSHQSLKDVCNAPSNMSGVYVVYALKNGGIELVYIGRSGRLKNDGTIFIRKAGLGGMKDRLVNGHQFGKVPRRISWPYVMETEKIEALDVYWYATHDNIYNDCPRIVKNAILKRYSEIYGQLPRWNKIP